MVGNNYYGPFGGGGGVHVRKLHYFAFGCQFWHRCYKYLFCFWLLTSALQSLHLGVHCGIRLSLILAHVTFVQRGYRGLSQIRGVQLPMHVCNGEATWWYIILACTYFTYLEACSIRPCSPFSNCVWALFLPFISPYSRSHALARRVGVAFSDWSRYMTVGMHFL